MPTRHRVIIRTASIGYELLLGCDTGAGGNVGKSGTIPDESEAEYVANTISKEGDGESPTRPFPTFSGRFYRFGQPFPEKALILLNNSSKFEFCIYLFPPRACI
jgi:hypothetical protein